MAKTEKKSFEESMKRLDEIVSCLEENEKPLDEAILLFEEGLNLVKECDNQLKAFEDRINSIVEKNGGESDEQN